MKYRDYCKNRKIDFTRQFDQMDCGPACIRMVSSAYGQDYPLSYLRTLSHLTREGVSIAGIRDALKTIGMRSASFELTMEQLIEKCPLPSILHWDQNHFVVLYGISNSCLTRTLRFKIANPAFGKQTISYKEFTNHWLNNSKGIVIACEPTDKFYSQIKIKKEYSILRFARKFVWPYKWEMAQIAMGMLFGVLLSLVTPFLTQAMVDEGIGLRDMNVIISIMMAQLFLFFVSFFMGIIGSWVSLYMGTKINIDILENYIEKLLKLPMHFFETKSIGDYQQRIGDNNRLQGFVINNSMQTFFSLVSVPFLIIVIAFYSRKILFVYVLFTIASTLWMMYFFKQRKALDYERFKLNAQNQNKMYELISGIDDIKVNVFEDYKLKEWHDMQEQIYAMSQKRLKLNQIQNTGYTFIGQLRNIIITFWIAHDVVNGFLTLGMMMSISNIIGQLNGPLSQLVNFLQQYQDAKISLERSEEVHMCEPEDLESMEQLDTLKPYDIEFNHVSFSYTGNIGKNALDDISFRIPAGKTTAIVGESGSGKTTLMKLLLKFYNPNKGSIKIGGKDLKQINSQSIRRVSGVVMQNNYIFSGTLKDNIILGLKQNKNTIDMALESACLKQFICNHPLGIETKLGNEGIGVSGGEKQRIMIARAIYKQPLYFMMDEATSSLDAETEKIITENLSNFCKERTMIVIAHRLSTIKNADNIIVLRHGKIIEMGNHLQLVALKGYYYELIKNQLELEK